MVTTESFRTALPVEQGCKYSQFQQSTECSRQHISPTTSKTTWVCLDATLGVKAHRWVPGQYPRYTDARKGRPWVAQMHHKRQQAANKTQTLVEKVNVKSMCSTATHVSDRPEDLAPRAELLHPTANSQRQQTEETFADPAKTLCRAHFATFLSSLAVRGSWRCLDRSRVMGASVMNLLV